MASFWLGDGARGGGGGGKATKVQLFLQQRRHHYECAAWKHPTFGFSVFPIMLFGPCREGASKVFQMPLTPAQAAKNQVQGTAIRPIVVAPDGSGGESSWGDWIFNCCSCAQKCDVSLDTEWTVPCHTPGL